MNETEIEQFRQKLLSLRSKLQKLEESSNSVASDQAGLGQLSRMGAMQEQLVVEKAVRQRQRQLGKIEGAFRRIEAGEYGNCFVCSEEIDIHRLSEDPTCTRCVTCDES
jgi:RNA polymerase-binding transcription factor